MVKLANEEQSQVKRATRAAYGATLAELANEGLPVVAVDADLTGSTTTKKLADAGFADRLFNCGIAEQNMVDVAAGLAATGHIAYTGSFAVFGTGRAYDQIRNTVCYSNLEDRPHARRHLRRPRRRQPSDARGRFAHARASEHARARAGGLRRGSRGHPTGC